ncbi:MAG: ParB N-terminal domain-containing protein [Paracoccaceae bacterium]
MAKRKRLTPAENAALDTNMAAAPETKAMAAHPFGVQPVATRRPPIAQVAGDAAAQAALDEVADELRAAKTSGRMVLELRLDAVDATYLVRDRLVADEDELSVLMASLTARGQQTPIEVVELGQGKYGLISGWRRLTALARLHAADGQGGYGTVQALLRRPEAASDAYLAMVEENEIRVGLSFYERARIVARAAEQGVYPDQAAALKGLFGSVSRSKRSKIGSFLKLYAALDDRLQYPSAISERLGLALVRALGVDPGQGDQLRERMRRNVAETAEMEMAALERFLDQSRNTGPLTGALETVIIERVTKNQPVKLSPGISLVSGKGRVVLSGKEVTPELVTELSAWLRRRPLGGP